MGVSSVVDMKQPSAAAVPVDVAADPVVDPVADLCTGEILERVGEPVSSAEITAFMARLAVDSPARVDGERVERIGALEGLKAAAAAAQAHDLVAFADSQVQDQAGRGVRARDRGRGIASQVGLACRQSPHRGARMLGTARALLSDLPHTLAALAAGETTEYRATLVAGECAVLEPGQRRLVDAEIGPRLGELGDRQVQAQARAWVCRLDPAAAVKRASKAHSERRVTIRPAPDTMTYLTGLLPVREGVSVFAALDAAAKEAAAAGDPRSRGQVMADTLVERVTGAGTARSPIEIQLIMTDQALFAGGSEPAQVPGYGPIPAEVARRWILSVLDVDGTEDTADTAHNSNADDNGNTEGAGHDETDGATRQRWHARGRAWLRRLYTSPDRRHLVAMDSHRRAFPALLRRLIEYRDQVCATPYCGAPIRHIDHTEPVHGGGATTYTNGRGTCVRCNLAKEAPGWSAIVTDSTTVSRDASADDVHGKTVGAERVVTLTTPTGHTYASRPPPAHRDPGFDRAG